MLKAQWSPPPHTYVGGVVFLTTHIFLLPNGDRNSLDIFTIPDDLTLEPLNPIARFYLPRLKGDFRTYISCRAEPNPRLPTNLPRDNMKPFYDSPKRAIILFQYRPSYVFFVHRSAFLDLLASKNLPDADSKDLEPTSLAWEEWGPTSSRFLSSKNIDLTWITTTAGERALLFPNRTMPAPAHRTVPYVVLDFNKERIRKMRNWISRTEEELGEFPYLPLEGVSDVSLPEEEKTKAQKRETLNRVWVVEGKDIELTEGFEEPVTSLLPYFACTATSNADNHWWNGAIMDNEHVIGMGVCCFFRSFILLSHADSRTAAEEEVLAFIVSAPAGKILFQRSFYGHKRLEIPCSDLSLWQFSSLVSINKGNELESFLRATMIKHVGTRKCSRWERPVFSSPMPGPSSTFDTMFSISIGQAFPKEKRFKSRQGKGKQFFVFSCPNGLL